MSKNKKHYSINTNRLREVLDEGQLNPPEVAMLIVISEFDRPVTEEETYEKYMEYGLDRMTDAEIMIWIKNKMEIKKQQFLN
jgi:hypothetical protein